MKDVATAALEEPSAQRIEKDFSSRPFDNRPSGAFSKIDRIELDDEEYDALLASLADPTPRECPDELRKAIREELIRMERMKGV
jgi:hypothetical protein